MHCARSKPSPHARFLASPSPHYQWHLDRFSRFCTVRCRVQLLLVLCCCSSNRRRRSCVAHVLRLKKNRSPRSTQTDTQTTPELSTGPLSVTRSDPTRQLTDPTRPNLLQVEKFRPNPIQLTNLTAWCNQVLSNRALNALT